MIPWGSLGRRDLGLQGGGRAAKEWIDEQDKGKISFFPVGSTPSASPNTITLIPAPLGCQSPMREILSPKSLSGRQS